MNHLTPEEDARPPALAPGDAVRVRRRNGTRAVVEVTDVYEDFFLAKLTYAGTYLPGSPYYRCYRSHPQVYWPEQVEELVTQEV